jgi:hypothetical protein
MFTFTLNEWLTRNNELGDFLTVNSLHPGVALTELYVNVWWVKIMPFLARALFRVSPKK